MVLLAKVRVKKVKPHGIWRADDLREGRGTVSARVDESHDWLRLSPCPRIDIFF